MMDVEKLETEVKDLAASAERTVFLWGQGDVLMQAVESLLVTGTGWKVIRIYEDWYDGIHGPTMEKMTSDVLIVHKSVFTSDTRSLVRFVREHPRLKIITISLDDNQMEIYNKQTICVQKVSDLFSAIENDADLHTSGGVSLP